ncbi:MAG: hypothetical protein QOE93_2343, partial [Actinomycetota bacterium]|nr:hypothetical protein [Actinomycetota bacterium]
MNLVPGGLEVHDGVVYVALTCTAESVPGQSAAARQALLRGFVYTFDGVSFTQVANFPLNYSRGSLTWLPWAPTATGGSSAPQPWLMGIEIDDQGFMVVGVTDRFGHQSGVGSSTA